MGDCYSVELRVKVNPRKSTVSNLQKLLRQWMKDKAKGMDGRPGVNWGLAEMRRAGLRPDSFAGICKILLAFHQGDAKHIRDDEGFDVYRSGFNASYEWASVMARAFFKMSWALEKGSRLWFNSDSGTEQYEVEDGEDDNTEVWENHNPPYERR